ncbi:MAG: prolyl oligopeptidase family serine peptidase [Rivularia sp. ALOHA_DT_140]|nr:prolyl oligopeptidase family serine peptidase [Rivularia sp. ALOHA_DT_140]
MSKKNYPTIEEFIAFPKPLNPCISKDGKKLAYVQRSTNWDKNTFIYNIWIYENGKNYPLTQNNTDSSLPKWCNDSQALAYLVKTNEKYHRKQIFIKQNKDAAAIQISHAPDGVKNYKWSPDGNGFYFIAREPEPKNIKKRREIYGDIDYVDKEYRYQHLFYIDIQTGIEKTTACFKLPKDLREKKDESGDKDKNKEEIDELAVQITQSELNVNSFDISPHGDKIIFGATPSPRVEDVRFTEIYLLDIESKQVEKLDIPHPGRKGRILFSTDGKKICFTFNRDNKIYNNRLLAIFNLDTKIINYPRIEIDENIHPLQWIEKGIVIYWQNKTNSCIGIAQENGNIKNLTAEDCYIHSASISFDGEDISYIKADLNQYFEVYLNNTQITNYSHLLNNYFYTKKQIIEWSSSDGTKIEGILCTPPDFDPEHKYPLLVKVHGGPMSTSLAIPFGDNPIYPIENLKKKGFIILQPNYRGSNGYGETFRSLNYRNLGNGDYEDVISGIDYLISQGYVNPEKIGIMGWSQGGYISAFCSTYRTHLVSLHFPV